MLLGIILLLLVSCEDFSDLLEKEETGEMDLQGVFSDIRTAEQVLSNLYDRIHFYMNPASTNENGKLKQGALADTYSAFGATAMDPGRHLLLYLTGENGLNHFVMHKQSGIRKWDGRFYSFRLCCNQGLHAVSGEYQECSA